MWAMTIPQTEFEENINMVPAKDQNSRGDYAEKIIIINVKGKLEKPNKSPPFGVSNLCYRSYYERQLNIVQP